MNRRYLICMGLLYIGSEHGMEPESALEIVKEERKKHRSTELDILHWPTPESEYHLSRITKQVDTIIVLAPPESKDPVTQAIEETVAHETKKNKKKKVLCLGAIGTVVGAGLIGGAITALKLLT